MADVADVAFFRVSLSPIFSRTGYQKKATFLQPVVKKMSKGKILLDLIII